MPKINKARYQQLFELILDRTEIVYANRITALYNSIGQRFARAYAESNGMISHEAYNNQLVTGLMKILNELYEKTGNKYYRFFTQTQKQGIEKKAAIPNFFKNRIFEYLTTYSFQKASELTLTFENDILSIINNGINDAIGPAGIAKAIKDTIPVFSRARANTIARTETHNASTFAMQSSAESQAEETGLVFVREWSASSDERTRDAHREADGQQRGMNEPFTVDGESLMYPGDPSGSAGNVINCRCSVLYVPDV